MKTINELSATVDVLSQRVHELAAEVRTSNAEQRKRTSTLRLVVVALTVLVAVAVVAAATVLLDNRAQIAESNRRWCPMVVALVPQPGDPQPTTERGRLIAREFTRLSVDFGCDQQ